jgi:uncharacterized protein
MVHEAWFLAVPLALIAGFALQRGNICVVRAVREGVETRDWRLFGAILECAAWALAGLVLAEAAGLMRREDWPAQPSLLLAALGGATFGVGAMLNGACAFGTVGRLASGEWGLLAMPAGFVLGAGAARGLGLAAPLTTSAAAAPLALVLSALAVFVAFRLWGAWRVGAAATLNVVRAPHWPPPMAMAVLGLANVALLSLVFAWPYTTLLVDISTGGGMDLALRGALALTLAAGAYAGARSAGRFAWRAPDRAGLLSSLAGGALMGAGAMLIPGGNDGLVLLGLPLLQPSAFVAYAAMAGVIALGFAVRGVRET